MSTSVLKALPGKLEIKRYSPSILYVSLYAVESILSSLQLGKTAGQDAINKITLNKLKDVISTPLYILVNAYL